MKKKLNSRLLFLFLLSSCWLFGQPFKQDSLIMARGIENTTDFTPEKRETIEAYNGTGRPSIIRTDTNENGEWRPFRRRQLDYQDGRVSMVLVQSWDEGSQSFQDIKKRIYNYNSEDRLQNRLYQMAQEPGLPLANSERWEYEYDSEERLEILRYQRWENNDWGNNRRQMFTYAANGSLIEKHLQQWVNGQWQNFRRCMMTYDPDHGGLTEIIGQKWSTTNQNWENTRRKAYIYTANQMWSNEVVQDWDDTNAVWENDHQQFFQTGAQGQFDGRLRQVWNEGQWINQFRGGQSFDGEDLTIAYEKWNEDIEEWINHSRHQLQYNQQGNLLLSQGWQRWNAAMSQWLNDTNTLRFSYYWSELSTSVREYAAFSACQISNPYKIGAAINCTLPETNDTYQIELFDLFGRLMYTKSFNAYDQLTIHRQLPAGTYLIRIGNKKQGHHLQKLVILN
jgi:hypothetical protein